jgi:hypothetical protein
MISIRRSSYEFSFQFSSDADQRPIQLFNGFLLGRRRDAEVVALAFNVENESIDLTLGDVHALEFT